MGSADTARWNVLESWLEDPCWRPVDAAHILIDLDPGLTFGPCPTNGFNYTWLTHCRPVGLPTDSYSQMKNVEMMLEHSLNLTSWADPVKVSTPKEWVEWCVQARLEPAWLKPAVGNADIRRFLPSHLPAFRDIQTDTKTVRDIASAGGHAKALKSPAGRAKKLLDSEIDNWLNLAEPGPMNKAAERFAQLIEGQPGVALSVGTIIRHIRKRRAERR